jgi:hypothetical protein
MMRRGAVIEFYKSMPLAEQVTLRRWAKVNAVLFTILGGVLAATLAVASSAPQAAARHLETVGYNQQSTFAARPVTNDHGR